MITVFKKLRKKFLDAGKVQRYLFYAIGEVALVMIGILLALQVNNWNEQKIKKTQETAILNEIASDLRENEAAIRNITKTDSAGVINTINSLKIIHDHLRAQKAYHDSLDYYFTYMFAYNNLEYKISGYETLKSYGFDFIQNATLRKEIGIYYTMTVPQTRQSYNEVRDDFYNYMIDYLRKDFETFFTNSKEGMRSYYLPVSYSNLIQKNEFFQSINVFRDIQEIYLVNLNSSLTETQVLLALVENYLESK